jgi:hypothetical protein
MCGTRLYSIPGIMIDSAEILEPMNTKVLPLRDNLDFKVILYTWHYG